jgi:hypothetical protein
MANSPSEQGSTGKTLIVGGAAGILTGILATIALAQKAKAAGGAVSLDDTTMQLLTAIAQANAQMIVDVEAILAELPNLVPPGGGPIIVVTKNAPHIQTQGFTIDAVNTRYQLPAMTIPDGMSVVIKAWPGPINTGTIYVAESRDYALDINHIFPLSPGGVVSYQVKDASTIWVSGTVPGDRITITAEKI